MPVVRAPRATTKLPKKVCAMGYANGHNHPNIDYPNANSDLAIVIACICCAKFHAHSYTLQLILTLPPAMTLPLAHTPIAPCSCPEHWITLVVVVYGCVAIACDTSVCMDSTRAGLCFEMRHVHFNFQLVRSHIVSVFSCFPCVVLVYFT